jgi:hypothetical protein
VRGVIAAAHVEGCGERLGGKVVGQIGSKPAGKIAIHGVVVTIEDGRERARFDS